jgi:UDP-N-acetylmuramyl pentapeptide phosphotransferase/UDP-N-acetylglucosamine-1-phosphate transferase
MAFDLRGGLSVTHDINPASHIPMKLAGIILIVIGILALVYQGFSYTQTKQDAKIGPVEINHQETHSVPVPPIVGGVCIVAGVVALAVGARSNL